MAVGKPPFVMPRFSRIMWVSARAREAWEWKITAFAEAWRQVEWLAVVDKVRPCASFWLSQQELAPLSLLVEGYGLRAAPLLFRTQSTNDQRTLLYRVAIGASRDLRHFRKAFKRGDDDAIGTLLGYPACCRAFFRKFFVEAGVRDCIWPMATGTLPGDEDQRVVNISGALELNPFWIEAGVRITPHYPCRFDCPAAVALAKAFCDSGRKFGLARNIDVALEMFSWPAEWSALHGIAEIRTPLVKISRNSDATDFKRVVRQSGSGFPAEGARGLSFALKPLTGRHSLAVLG